MNYQNVLILYLLVPPLLLISIDVLIKLYPQQPLRNIRPTELLNNEQIDHNNQRIYLRKLICTG